MSFGNEPGWTGVFTREQHPDALPNDTLIVKIAFDKGDTHPIGMTGTVLGSVGSAGQLAYYFVEWAVLPRVAVGIMAGRIADAGPRGYRKPHKGAFTLRELPDGRFASIEERLFGAATLAVASPQSKARQEWDEGYDYKLAAHAFTALYFWNGRGEPEGWHRHVPSYRRRPDGDASKEEIRP